MHRAAVLPLLASLGTIAAAAPAVTDADIIVNSFQLYPENADYDFKRKLLHFGALYNSSIAAYSPSKNTIEKITEFPPLTNDTSYHASGVKVDPFNDRLSVIVNPGAAWTTAGENITGDTWLIKLDLKTGDELWRSNLTTALDGKYGGYQDVAHDAAGNSYVIGTFPGSILKVDPIGKKITPWYVSEETNTTVTGFTGIVYLGTKFLTTYGQNGQLQRWDSCQGQGKPTPVPIGTTGTPPTTDAVLQNIEAITLPKKYEGKVLLVASNSKGVYVLRSKDGSWDSAENLGAIPNNYESDGVVVTTVQVEDRLYAVLEYFDDIKNPVPETVAGNRTEFPLQDITSAVEEYLQK
ncbi:Trichothecene biosynthesis protein 14 [Metarhizium brunneum]|uniref:Trichothecene biosynthesis protein 14 n=1 Tax=Metarhizium brunneum TaxID=500148 RepID=A0A7D5YWF9_9HYPO